MIIGDMEIRLRADIARLQRDMDSARRVVGDATAGMSRAADAARMALASIGAGVGLAQLAQMSDAYAKFTAQLRLASVSAREYGVAYADVKRIATQSTQGLQETGVLYARIANGTRELGVAQKQVAAITETVNLSLLVSGATASEAASAQLQLSQAFASGTLRGEEFNAVNEAAPRLMLALADGIGVPVGALKKMAEEGKITSQIMADTLPTALAKLREEAKEITTISGAMTVLKNNLMEFVGMQASASGAVSALTGAIGFLSTNLGLIAGAVATLTVSKLSTWLVGMATQSLSAAAANRALAASTLAAAVTSTEAAATAAAAKLAEAQANVRATASAAALSAARVAELRASVLAASGAVQLAIATNGLIPAQARAIALTEANAVALAAQAVAANAATTASVASTGALAAQAAAGGLLARSTGVLRGAVAFLGGPIGAVVTLLGLAATAWMVWGKKSKEGNDLAKESAVEASAVIIAELDKQIDRNKKAIELRKQGVALDNVEKNIRNGKALGDLGNELASVNRGVGANGERLNNTEQLFAREKIMKSILDLTSKMNEAETTGAAAKALTQAEARNKFMKEYATKQEQMNEKLAEGRKLLGASFTAADEARIRSHFDEKAAGVKREQSAYQSLMTSIEEKSAANRLEMAGYEKLTDAQKMTIKLDAAISTSKNILSAESIASARKRIAIVAEEDEAIKAAALTLEMKNAAEKSLIQTDNEAYAKITAGTKSIDDQVIALRSQIEVYGLTELAVVDLAIAKVNAAMASGPASYAELIALDAQIEKLKELRALTEKKQSLDSGLGTSAAQAKELLEIMSALDEATKAAASGMAASFGKIGSAIGGLTTALSGYGRTQAAIAAQLAAVRDDKKNSPETVLKAEVAASKQSAQARVKSYGDMASAAKGFFKENSSGYRAMEKTEKAFRAAEMAMAIESMLKKSGLLAAFTGFFVASKATETAADTASTGASIVNSLARAGASLTAGVAKAFEQMGVWGFVGAAAIIAFMGKMGVFGGTGGGGPAPGTFEERQKKQGTGTVLGDDTAKSESISRSLEIMEQNSSTELNYQSSMLQALRSIESALGGAAKGIFQTTGLTGGSAFGTSNTSTKSFFGSDKSTTITDSGVKFSGTLGQLRAGAGTGIQYEDVTKTSDGGWFSGNKRWDLTNTKNLDEKTLRPFTLIFDSMGDLLVRAGVKLGADGEGLNNAINQIGIDFAVSTRELKGQDLIDALSAGVSVAFDKVATAVFPQVEEFQRVGEGMGETLVRVASNYATLDATLSSIGTTFGATGISSLKARDYLIELAGGIDVLTEQASGFAQNFLSEAERLVPVQQQVTAQMAALGYSSVTTREEFKNVVLGLDLSTKAGADAYAGLMRVQEAFALVTPAIEGVGSAAKTASAILDERLELQGRLDAATMTSVQLLDRQRSALDSSNQALFDSVLAAEAKKESDDALAQTNLGIQNDIDALVKASLPLSEQRALEVAGMAASTLALYERREALQEEAKALAASKAAAAALESTNAGFQKQIDDFLKASMTPAELRAVETKEMDKSTIALYDKLAGLKADKAAQDKLDQEERDRVAAEKQGAEEARRAAEKMRDAWQSITDTIFDEVARIRGLLDEGGVTSLSSAQSAFAIKTAQARAGDQDAAKLLPGLSKSLLELAEANALTSLDLRRFQAQTLGSLTDTGSLLSQQFGLKIPGFAVGTNYVPSDMLAQIHEGERIIPKADNARLEQRLSQGGDTGALEAAIDRLTATVAEQQATLNKISNSAKRSTDILEVVTEGGNAMRTEPA